MALIISYVLNPIVSMLGGRKEPRSIAVLLIYAFFLTCIGVIPLNAILVLIEQLEELNGAYARTIDAEHRVLMNSMDHKLMPPSVRNRHEQLVFPDGGPSYPRHHDADGQYRGNASMCCLTWFIVPFLIFYMLKDFEVFERTVAAYLPRSRRKAIVSRYERDRYSTR